MNTFSKITKVKKDKLRTVYRFEHTTPFGLVDGPVAQRLVSVVPIHEAVANQRLHLTESLLLKVLGRYETGKCLILVAVLVCLPPVHVLFGYDVQDVAFEKA